MDNQPLVVLLLADPDTDRDTWQALAPVLPGAVATAVWQTHPAADPDVVTDVVEPLDITAVPYDRALPLHAALTRSRRSSLAAALLERADPGAITYLFRHADPAPAALVRWVMNTQNRDALLTGAPAISLLDAPALRAQHTEIARALQTEAHDPATPAPLRLRMQLALTADAARTSTADYTFGQLRSTLELADIADAPGIVRAAKEAVAGGSDLLGAVAEVLYGHVDTDTLLAVLTPTELRLGADEVTTTVATRACHDHPSSRAGWWDLALRALAGGSTGPAHLVAVGATPPAGVLVDLTTAVLTGPAAQDAGDQWKDLVLVLAAHLRDRAEPEAEAARALLVAAGAGPDAAVTLRAAATLLTDPAALSTWPLGELAAAAGADTGNGSGLWLLADVLLADPEVRGALTQLRADPDVLAAALAETAHPLPVSLVQLRDQLLPTG